MTDDAQNTQPDPGTGSHRYVSLEQRYTDLEVERDELVAKVAKLEREAWAALDLVVARRGVIEKLNGLGERSLNAVRVILEVLAEDGSEDTPLRAYDSLGKVSQSAMLVLFATCLGRMGMSIDVDHDDAPVSDEATG